MRRTKEQISLDKASDYAAFLQLATPLSPSEAILFCDAAGARIIEGKNVCGIGVVSSTISDDGEHVLETVLEVCYESKHLNTQIAEALALQHAILWCEENNGFDRYRIYSDNAYCIALFFEHHIGRPPFFSEIQKRMVNSPVAIKISVRHIPGRLNILADKVSREAILTTPKKIFKTEQ